MPGRTSRTIASVCIALALAVAGVTAEAASRKVVIFHAGSLTVPMAEMEKQFEQLHPDIDVRREAGGSTHLARLISEVGKPADILVSADYRVIDNLIPDHAAWNIYFAANQMVLAYTGQSRYADLINADNWHEIVRKKDVSWGHSDPNLDPCGYRSLMVLQLAEKYYRKPGLYADVMANRPLKNVRPKSVELISLLQSGHLDYAWEYLSVAIQHGLKYVIMDDHINMGNYQYDSFYKQAGVRVSGSEPGTFIVRNGQSVTYGVTMIRQAANEPEALLFLRFLLASEKGLKILETMGQPPFVPARVPGREMFQTLPASLQDMVTISD